MMVAIIPDDNPPDGRYGAETFHGHMTKDGRISIPKLILERFEEKPSKLLGCVFRVALGPMP